MTDALPLVSVIVVCWNSGDVLGRCLKHLLDQEYSNYEVVVVDDGSQDDTLAVAQEALGRGKLTIVSSPLNRGCPHARNLGLRHARGDIIAFIDADGFAAPRWLQHIVEAFEADDTIGGVASTVFFASNPLVINGAGGLMNHQGWAADASGSESYERAQILSEAIYPMGCGMAVRRSGVEHVGPFDDHMLNYYDDLDYGVRLWRAGYRIVVAPDAWIDHAFGHSGGDSPRKQLLCEQHRMRCVLKHAPIGTLARWTINEAWATWRAWSPRHELKLEAVRWNVRKLPSTLLTRWRLRRLPRPPARLITPGWSESITPTPPQVRTPHPDRASNAINMSASESEGQLPYGWYGLEEHYDRTFRWADVQASVLMHLEAPAQKLQFEYRLASPKVSPVIMNLRRLDSPDPSMAIWTTRLWWQDHAWRVERHPVSLPPGQYEVVFSSGNALHDPPFDTRRLVLALTSLSCDDSVVMPAATLGFSDAESADQLISGWFDPERIDGRLGRWTAWHAAALLSAPEGASELGVSYHFPGRPSGGLMISVRRGASSRVIWSTRVAPRDTCWRDESFPVRLAPGEYAVSFDAETIWTNPEGRDPAFAPDDRWLGFAVSSLSVNTAHR